jgi:cytoskeletal protein CcmA (bactofilin family)
MQTKSRIQWLFVPVLIIIFALCLTRPVKAYEPRGGDIVIIEASEVIEDDVYVGAGSFTLRGTIIGDLIVFGSEINITSSGLIEGDLIALGQAVVIKGRVSDDVRVGGAAVTIESGAHIGGDLIAAGYSLDIEPDSTIDGELIFAGGQTRISGEIGGDTLVRSNAFQLEGTIYGDVNVHTGEVEDAPPFIVNPVQFIPGMPPVPNIRPGLQIDESAHIDGSLDYVARSDAEIPNDVVTGAIHRTEPKLPESEIEPETPPTPTEMVLSWLLGLARRVISLMLVGLLLLWLVPEFLEANVSTLRRQPMTSLLWGAAVFFFFIVGLVAVIFLTALLVTIFSAATLHQLTLTTIFTGVTTLLGSLLVFRLVIYYLAYIVVGLLIGGFVIDLSNGKSRYKTLLTLIIGVFLLSILSVIPYVGFLVNMFVLFLGLGVLWLMAKDKYANSVEVVEESTEFT